jgi:hypothetical protein
MQNLHIVEKALNTFLLALSWSRIIIHPHILRQWLGVLYQRQNITLTRCHLILIDHLISRSCVQILSSHIPLHLVNNTLPSFTLSNKVFQFLTTHLALVA